MPKTLRGNASVRQLPKHQSCCSGDNHHALAVLKWNAAPLHAPLANTGSTAGNGIGAFAGIDGVSDAWDTRFQKAVNAAQSTKVS